MNLSERQAMLLKDMNDEIKKIMADHPEWGDEMPEFKFIRWKLEDGVLVHEP